MQSKRLLSGLLLALLATTFARGFTFIANDDTHLPVKWPAGPVPFVIALGTSSTLSDGNTYNSSAQAAIDIWNAQLGSVQLQGQSAAPRSAGNGNDVNELVFSNTVFGTAFDSNVVAVTTRWSLGNERAEADIILNTAQSWDSYRGNSRGGVIDLRRVAIHEFGHALGLGHPDEAGQSVSAVMNSRVSNLDTLAADDISGARQLYGPPGIPANDNFANAISISLSTGSTQATGFNTNATKQSGEPAHAQNSGGRSVWWRWTAPGSGPATINTQGSVFDTTLGVYTGSTVNALTTIAFDDDVEDGTIQYSTVTFNATAGTTYSFAVDGFDADSGAITLNLSFTSAPEIIQQPASGAFPEGSPAFLSFTVKIPGASVLDFTWFKDGSPANFGDFDIVSTGILGNDTYESRVQISQFHRSYAGTYTVRASTTTATLTSSPAVITVLNQSEPTAVTVGRSISFYAGAGTSFQWQVSNDMGFSWTNLANDSTYTGVTSDTLSISNASESLNNLRYRALSTTGGVTTPGTSFTLTVAPAFFPNPSGIYASGSGELIIADSSLNTLQRVSAQGSLTPFVGTAGQTGSTNGSGAAARFNQPSGVTPGSDSPIFFFVADTANSTIRRVSFGGDVTTFAGSPSARGNTDGTSATFSSPTSIVCDRTYNNLYIADKTNHTIRRITSAGVTSTFAGAAGVPGTTNATVATNARFNNPSGLALDAAGNLFVADTFNHTIRKITPAGVVTTFAGVEQSSGTSDGTGPAALFNGPTGLTVDTAGNLFVADTANSTIRRITPAGIVTTYAGLPTISGLRDGTGNDAWFNQPQGIAIDWDGNLYVTDTGNAVIRKITPARVVTTLIFKDNTRVTPTNPAPPMPVSGGGGGGGGAPSTFFFSALAILCCLKVERALRAR